GPHDHAAAQKPLVDVCGATDADRKKVAEGRDVLESERRRALLDLLKALKILRVTARYEFHIVERRRGCGECETIDVEGLAHAVHHVRDRRMCQRVADSKSGKAIRLGESSRDDEV